MFEIELESKKTQTMSTLQTQSWIESENWPTLVDLHVYNRHNIKKTKQK